MYSTEWDIELEDVKWRELWTCQNTTENEGISCVTAWCAAENIGSRKVLEKAGMHLILTEKDGLLAGDRVYDKMIYEYRMKP